MPDTLTQTHTTLPEGSLYPNNLSNVEKRWLWQAAVNLNDGSKASLITRVLVETAVEMNVLRNQFEEQANSDSALRIFDAIKRARESAQNFVEDIDSATAQSVNQMLVRRFDWEKDPHAFIPSIDTAGSEYSVEFLQARYRDDAYIMQCSSLQPGEREHVTTKRMPGTSQWVESIGISVDTTSRV